MILAILDNERGRVLVRRINKDGRKEENITEQFALDNDLHSFDYILADEVELDITI